MEELYTMIEQLIEESGCTLEIDGREFYEEISAEADEKENGTYMFGINKGDDIAYTGCMTIMDEQFDLHYVDIHVGDTTYHVNFDVE